MLKCSKCSIIRLLLIDTTFVQIQSGSNQAVQTAQIKQGREIISGEITTKVKIPRWCLPLAATRQNHVSTQLPSITNQTLQPCTERAFKHNPCKVLRNCTAPCVPTISAHISTAYSHSQSNHTSHTVCQTWQVFKTMQITSTHKKQQLSLSTWRVCCSTLHTA